MQKHIFMLVLLTLTLFFTPTPVSTTETDTSVTSEPVIYSSNHKTETPPQSKNKDTITLSIIGAIVMIASITLPNKTSLTIDKINEFLKFKNKSQKIVKISLIRK